MKIYCCGCGHDVDAVLVRGEQVYPHRPDLFTLPFWRCDGCRNYVGCHHKTSTPTKPLGNIPTPAIRSARQRIHRILDPIWMGKPHRKNARRRVYKDISDILGYHFHTSEIKSVEEADKIFAIVKQIEVRHAV